MSLVVAAESERKLGTTYRGCSGRRAQCPRGRSVADMRVQDLQLTTHAVERYHERLCPGLRLADARKRLELLILEHGQLVQAPPEWIANQHDHRERLWLMLGEDVALPVTRSGWVVSCLARGGLSPTVRQRRKYRRVSRRVRRASERRRRGRAAVGRFNAWLVDEMDDI